MNQPWDPNNRYPALLDRREAQDSDEWLLYYADLSTLIIVFLVLMFAFSDFDKNNSTTGALYRKRLLKRRWPSHHR